jgi:hypothetical protein
MFFRLVINTGGVMGFLGSPKVMKAASIRNNSPWKRRPRPSHCHLASPGAPGACRGTEVHPDFLLRGPHQRPRVRLSVKEAA